MQPLSAGVSHVTTGANDTRLLLDRSSRSVAAIGGTIFTAAAILIDYGMPFSRELPALITSPVVGTPTATWLATPS